MNGLSAQAAPPSLLRLASPLFLGRGVASILTFAIPVLLARRLDPHEYGTYKQFFLVATTFHLGAQLGLGASLYYFLPREGAARGRYVVQALVLLGVVGLVAAALVTGGAGELARRFDNPALLHLAPALAIYVWAMLASVPLEIALTASGRTGWAGLAYVLSDAARTIALLAPIGAGLGLPGLAWGAAAFAGLRVLAAWVVALSGGSGRALPPTRGTLRRQLAYALPFGGAVLVSIVQIQLPPYLIAGLTTAATFAVYAVGALQIPFTDVVYTPVAEVMMVRLAGAPRPTAPAIFREAVSRLVLFFLPLAAFAWATAPELIPTLYTEQYRAAVPIFMLAAGEVLLSTLPIDGLHRAIGSTRDILRVNVARLVFTAAAVPAGLALLGLPGAMAGYLATQVLGKLLLLRAGARRLDVPIRRLLPWRAIGLWAALSGLIYLAVTGVRLFLPWRGPAFLLAAAATGGLAWLLALVSTGELGALRRRPAARPLAHLKVVPREAR